MRVPELASQNPEERRDRNDAPIRGSPPCLAELVERLQVRSLSLRHLAAIASGERPGPTSFQPATPAAASSSWFCPLVVQALQGGLSHTELSHRPEGASWRSGTTGTISVSAVRRPAC